MKLEIMCGLQEALYITDIDKEHSCVLWSSNSQ